MRIVPANAKNSRLALGAFLLPLACSDAAVEVQFGFGEFDLAVVLPATGLEPRATHVVGDPDLGFERAARFEDEHRAWVVVPLRLEALLQGTEGVSFDSSRAKETTAVPQEPGACLAGEFSQDQHSLARALPGDASGFVYEAESQSFSPIELATLPWTRDVSVSLPVRKTECRRQALEAPIAFGNAEELLPVGVIVAGEPRATTDWTLVYDVAPLDSDRVFALTHQALLLFERGQPLADDEFHVFLLDDCVGIPDLGRSTMHVRGIEDGAEIIVGSGCEKGAAEAGNCTARPVDQPVGRIAIARWTQRRGFECVAALDLPALPTAIAPAENGRLVIVGSNGMVSVQTSTTGPAGGFESLRLPLNAPPPPVTLNALVSIIQTGDPMRPFVIGSEDGTIFRGDPFSRVWQTLAIESLAARGDRVSVLMPSRDATGADFVLVGSDAGRLWELRETLVPINLVLPDEYDACTSRRNECGLWEIHRWIWRLAAIPSRAGEPSAVVASLHNCDALLEMWPSDRCAAVVGGATAQLLDGSAVRGIRASDVGVLISGENGRIREARFAPR